MQYKIKCNNYEAMSALHDAIKTFTDYSVHCLLESNKQYYVVVTQGE